MDTAHTSNPIHPLLMIAALGVVALSLAGAAAIIALLPKSHTEDNAVPALVHSVLSDGETSAGSMGYPVGSGAAGSGAAGSGTPATDATTGAR